MTAAPAVPDPARLELEPDDQVAIEAVTLQLTERRFGPALERLARAGDDRGDLAVRDVFGL